MNENHKFLEPPPKRDGEFEPKIIWMGVALLPSVIGMACFGLKGQGQPLLSVLLVLDLIFSVAGSIGLVREIKNETKRFVLGFFLTGFFSVLNAFIVAAIGCAGMGRK